MKPDIERFIDVAAMYLITQLAPSLESKYDQSNVATLGALLTVLREEYDRAAARRVDENRALRRLFTDAVPAVGDTALRAKIEHAAASEDTSFLISELERTNSALRALLIELHAHVEQLATPDARRIETAIWAELAKSTERRRLMLAPF